MFLDGFRSAKAGPYAMRSSSLVERRAQRSVFDWEMLNPMSRARDYTYGAQLGFWVALRALLALGWRSTG